MSTPSREILRPLLMGGERLRQDAERPRNGGGDKYVPFGLEQAAYRLLPEVAQVGAQARDVPQRLRGDPLPVRVS